MYFMMIIICELEYITRFRVMSIFGAILTFMSGLILTWTLIIAMSLFSTLETNNTITTMTQMLSRFTKCTLFYFIYWTILISMI